MHLCRYFKGKISPAVDLPLFLMAAIVVITIPTTIITNTNNISQFALQLNFIFRSFDLAI